MTNAKPGIYDFSDFYKKPEEDEKQKEIDAWWVILNGPQSHNTLRLKWSLQPTLEEITAYDRTFVGQVTIHPNDLKPEEIQIDIGGYRSGNPYSVSIVANINN